MLVETHDAVFRRTARRYSICADDSEDAYQRALEILLTKAPPIEGDALVRWMQTVTKREALAVRRQRERLLGSPRLSRPDEDDERDPLDSIASESPGPNDRLARRERVVRSAEALNALKPQEVRALTLKAQGYSYAEIGEITGWSYTKINRCMAEGRKRFLQVFADIEHGRRCDELAAALSEMADGEDANGSTEALEFHLRVCAADVATGPGVANQACEQRPISIDNTCQDSTGATGQAQSLSAGLEDPQTGRLQRTRAVRSSAPVAIRGQLTGSNGPVKAASVCVYETVDEPAGIEQLLQVARSSSTGHFGVEIPGGPSRIFRVAYRYNDRQIESPNMYLDSSVQPTLQLSKSKLSNGRAVGFRGRIPGPNADGRAVTMQAKVGKKWRSFKQLVTDGNGHFTGKYRFTQTRGLVRYVFRALVKKQGGYPYSAGASPKRKVVVYG